MFYIAEKYLGAQYLLDYIMLSSWNEMVWNVTGEVKVENTSIEEVCHQNKTSYKVPTLVCI